MSDDLPERPRLSEGALPRRHIVDGDEVVVLHDVKGGGVICLDERAWCMLSCADGTRDLEGIRLAAGRAGAKASSEVLADFLSALHNAGLIANGPPEVSGLSAVEAAAAAAAVAADDIDALMARPLEPLPDYAFTCDNRGSCCRRYGTIIFSQLEAAQARAHLPQLRGCGDRPRKMFMPERGVYDDGALTVAMVNGRCAFYALDGEGEGHCAIHAAAGADQKPRGCSVYPRSFVDDGEVVRVSTSLECACVFASVGKSAGESLLPAGASCRGDLHPAVYVATLPSVIELGGGRTGTVEELRPWSRALVATPPGRDAAAGLWSLANTVEERGLVVPEAVAAMSAPAPLVADALRPWLEALAKNARDLKGWDAEWRSERDVARRATSWVAKVAGELSAAWALEALLAKAPAEPAAERFYLRATLHGHRQIGKVPLSTALRDLAVRLLVARALPAVVDIKQRGDLAREHPLALVEAMLRGHGLADYVDKLVP